MAEPSRGPEILAPAGTPAKLRTALHFGADAVYLGLSRYSLRKKAGNFDLDELEWAIDYAHGRGRKVYVAVNIQPFDSDLSGIERALKQLADLDPDAVIVADPGVLALARTTAPGVRIHLSTQASVTNSAAARFWLDQGVTRIIAARELSLEQLGRIALTTPGEIEAFVHGSVCIAYSGRCLLSLYWAGRDPRRGDCAAACRWRYTEIEDRRRPGLANPIEEDDRGTYFFDAKDLCAIPVLDRLLATGVHSLKIEGRTRSAHYVAVAVDVYRDASRRLARGDVAGFRQSVPRYLDEFRRTGTRGMSTHFLTGEQDSLDAYNPKGSYPDGRFEYVGEVVSKDDSSLVVEIRNPVRPGCLLEVRDKGLRREVISVDRVQGEEGQTLEIARTGVQIRLAGAFESGVGAIVRMGVDPAAGD